LNQSHLEDNTEDTESTLEETPAEDSEIHIKQDGYRHVIFGQLADGLIPPHQGEPEATEDDLSNAALSDTSTETENQNQPTIWRIVFVITLIAVALAIVFWKK
jgi:hypothetical protein